MWPFTKKDPVVAFWTFFEANQDRFRSPPPDRAAMDRLQSLLSAIQAGLVFEFSLEGGKLTSLAISAEGNKALFPAVIRVVEAAPALDGWKIVPFRQPGEADACIQLGNTKLEGSHIWFSANATGREASVTLHVHGMTKENHRALTPPVLVLLDNAVGELAAASIASVDFAPCPTDPRASGLKPLSELAEFVRSLSH